MAILWGAPYISLHPSATVTLTRITQADAVAGRVSTPATVATDTAGIENLSLADIDRDPNLGEDVREAHRIWLATDGPIAVVARAGDQVEFTDPATGLARKLLVKLTSQRFTIHRELVAVSQTKGSGS